MNDDIEFHQQYNPVDMKRRFMFQYPDSVEFNKEIATQVLTQVIQKSSDIIAEKFVEENYNEIAEKISAKAVAKLALIETAKKFSNNL